MVGSSSSPLSRILLALLLAGGSAFAQAPDTVSLILIDGDMRADWPDRGVVGFHRTGTTGDLPVSFTLGGSAILNTEYTTTAAASVTIPAGDREAWVEFAPAGPVLGAAAKTITVTLQSGPGYNSADAAVQTVKLAPASAKPSAKAAVRFLNQAAFGPSGDLRDVQEVMTFGYDQWITRQFVRPVGLQQPLFDQIFRARRGRLWSVDKVLAWWSRVMSNAPTSDLLRQRVGFALSEIMVVSDRLEQLSNHPSGMLNYYDTLLRGAFGNYRTLLYNVATHPCMGAYLNHLGNQKGDPEEGTFADENFAREIMQLFSIGLWELNLDGTRKLDPNGQPIPSYDNTTIANLARVMTGFGFGGPRSDGFWDWRENFQAPMRMWDEFHDLGAKTLLNGVTLPARTASDPDKGTAGLADLHAAIDCLFNHPNTAPFVSKQLIQKLVTSNPTPAYVGRVAAKFVNNGSGVRGDLKAVVRAILMDPEARDPQLTGLVTSGKLKEPYLRTANLARAVGARAANGLYEMQHLEEIHFQQPLSSPSVFNFFKPGYSPAGPVSEAGLVAPEFQILNAVTALSLPNYFLNSLQNGFNRWGSSNPRAIVRPQLAAELALVNDVPALLRRLDLLLTGGTLPKEQHQVIREAVEQIDSDIWQWKQERVRMAIYLIVSSPEFAILK